MSIKAETEKQIKYSQGDQLSPMKKPKRNDPCYCGSGRKYKKCCLIEVETIMDKKKNTFRDDIESNKVSPAEEMNRNQAVHLINLRAEKEMLGFDREHLESQIAKLIDRQRLITSMPDCECRTAAIESIGQRIEKIGKAVAASQFNGLSEMTLDALEKLGALRAKIDIAGAVEQEPSND